MLYTEFWASKYLLIVEIHGGVLLEIVSKHIDRDHLHQTPSSVCSKQHIRRIFTTGSSFDLLRMWYLLVVRHGCWMITTGSRHGSAQFRYGETR